jgi:hypothetical protein
MLRPLLGSNARLLRRRQVVQLRRGRSALRFDAADVLRGADVPRRRRSAVVLRMQEALYGERGLSDELLRSYSELESERVSRGVVLYRAVSLGFREARLMRPRGRPVDAKCRECALPDRFPQRNDSNMGDL